MVIRKCWKCQNSITDNSARLCPVCGAYNRLSEKIVEEWVIVCHKCHKATKLVDGEKPSLCRCGSIFSKSKDEVMKREEFLKRQIRDNEKKDPDEPEKTTQVENSTVQAGRSAPELVLECLNEPKRITIRAVGDEDVFALGRGGVMDKEFFSKYRYKTLSDIPVEIKYSSAGWDIKANKDNEVCITKADDGRSIRLSKDAASALSDKDIVLIGGRLSFNIRIGQDHDGLVVY